MAHGPIDIAFNLTVGAIKSFQHGFNLCSFGLASRRAGVGEPGKSLRAGETPDAVFIDHAHRPDHGEPALEEFLARHHGADLSSVTDIQKKRLNDIVFVMSQCQFGASQTVGDLKQTLPSQAGTQEAGVFPVFITVSDRAMVGDIYAEIEAHLVAGICQFVCKTAWIQQILSVQ